MSKGKKDDGFVRMGTAEASEYGKAATEDFAETPPARATDGAEPAAFTGRFRVVLDGQPPLTVEAQTEGEAYDKYKRAYGINASEHRPRVEPTELPAGSTD